jgi:hypothetical protein
MVEGKAHGCVVQVCRNCHGCASGADPGADLGLGSLTLRVYAVVSEQAEDEALELFVDRQMTGLMVENWDRDEPDRAGELRVEPGP